MSAKPKRSTGQRQSASANGPATRRPQTKAGRKSTSKTTASSQGPRRRAGRGTGKAGGGAASLFPKVARNRRLYGLAAVCAVVECDGTKPVVTAERLEELFTKPARRPRERFLAAASDECIAKLCNAMANSRRVAMLKAIFTGAGSYAELSESLQLKAGPLYHHVRELRLAGLLELAQRDTYRLTEYGKHALLLACVNESLLSKIGADRRD